MHKISCTSKIVFLTICRIVQTAQTEYHKLQNFLLLQLYVHFATIQFSMLNFVTDEQRLTVCYADKENVSIKLINILLLSQIKYVTKFLRWVCLMW